MGQKELESRLYLLWAKAGRPAVPSLRARLFVDGLPQCCGFNSAQLRLAGLE